MPCYVDGQTFPSSWTSPIVHNSSKVKVISHAGSSHGLRSRSLHDVNRNSAALAPSYSMSDPSITVAEAFKQFSQVTVSAVGPSHHITSRPPVHSPPFQFPASRLRAWDSCETHPSRGRSTRPPTRTRRLDQRSQRLQRAVSGLAR